MERPDLLTRWHFRGWLCGYAIAEIVMAVFSDGLLTAAKAAAKAGKLSEILAKFPKIAELAEKAKALKGEKIEKLRIALKSSEPLLLARQWAANVLRIPTEILKDLSLEAIERLKTLPRWAKDRFSELNHGAMRRILGCASPCKVDLQEVERYLRNLAADAVAGAKRLTTAEDVLNALPQDLLNLNRLQTELQKPRLMNIIRQAELTDLDFAKIRDFITQNLTRRADDSYYTFTGYLNALIPSKLGPNLNRFIEYANANLSDRAGSALRGPMFENFLKLYIPELRGLDRAEFKVPKYKKDVVNVDAFDTSTGTIWEFKYQANKLASKEANKYVPILGQNTTDGKYQANIVNFVFATENQAQLNKNINQLANHHVFFVNQLPGEAIRLIKL